MSEPSALDSIIRDNGPELRRIVSAVLRLSVLREPDLEVVEIGEGMFQAGSTLCVVAPSPLKKIRAGEDRGKKHKLLIRRLIVISPFGKTDNPDSKKLDIHKSGLLSVFWIPRKSMVPEWIDADELCRRTLAISALALRYGPERRDDRQRIQSIRNAYNKEFLKLYGKLQFIGMSVYKEEAASGVDLERIYIPLRVVPEGTAPADDTIRTDPLGLLSPGNRHVILGEPGCGKSTLLRFLGLVGFHPPLMARFGKFRDVRLPVFVVLRQFADELKGRPDLDIVDYVVEIARGFLGVPGCDREFLEYYLEVGEAVLLFDGIDELPDPQFKRVVRDKIHALLCRYPGNTTLVTSRIVGYEKEVRYEGIGFSHHQVARLTLPDIEGFVNNWYRARIDNEQDRALHAGDLIRIVHHDDCRAIRDLAENPLLLTIICLVHRIDAVLPDERVVLYQKCTETLLNTWHAWKFKIEHQKSRNKVERRNRARMEFIAHWMHAAMGTQDKGMRAVVPYEDLLDILAEYIAVFDKPRYEAPRELAEIFLRFVRERAGLLIEAGDRQYSFVHLTFQEYLTATFLRKSGEAGGIAVVWAAVRDKIGQSRWHEVLRLLVGALEQTESQRYVLEQIRMEDDDSGIAQRALLLGGCLLDGVDAAEEMEEEILEEWLHAATTTRSDSDLGELLQQMFTWMDRAPGGKALLQDTVKRMLLARAGLSPEVALLLATLGWSGEEIAALGTIGWSSGVAGRVFDRISIPSSSSTPVLHEDLLRFLDSARVGIKLSAPLANLGGVLFGAMAHAYERDACFPRFSNLLAALHFPDAFAYYIAHAILLGVGLRSGYVETQTANEAEARRERLIFRALGGALGGATGRVPDTAWVLDRALGRAQVYAWVLDRAQDRARALFRARTLHQALDRARARARDRVWALYRAGTGGLDEAPDLAGSTMEDTLSESATSFIQRFSGDAKARSALLDLFCDLLQLEPRPHWKSMLARCLLPYAGRAITLIDPALWKATESAIAAGHPTPLQCENAACLLLFDSWLWLYGGYETAEETLFPVLVKNRDIDYPALRLAHVLRDLAYGHESRAADLQAMVHSRDPAYRQLFIDAFWIDDEMEKKKA
jgi:hypothetical protein